MPSSHCRWQTSRRRDRLPGDWQRIRAKVKAGAGGKCQAKRHAKGCNGIGTDSDHSVSGDDNSWTTSNGFQTLAIKQRQKERKRRAMHGIAKSDSIPPKQIRDRSNLSIVRRFRQRHDFVWHLGGKSPNTIKAPLKSKSSSTLLERVPEVNYGHPIDFVVGGFRGVLYPPPPRAFRSASGN